MLARTWWPVLIGAPWSLLTSLFPWSMLFRVRLFLFLTVSCPHRQPQHPPPPCAWRQGSLPENVPRAPLEHSLAFPAFWTIRYIEGQLPSWTGAGLCIGTRRGLRHMIGPFDSFCTGECLHYN
jgi:hypothetical protein